MTKNTPYFIDEAKDRFLIRSGPKENYADILIVGCGMNGLSVALALSNKVDPRKITLIDSGRVGFSTTGKSAGLLTTTSEADFYESDQEIFYQTQKGLDDLIETIKHENIRCGLHEVPSLYLATKKGIQTKKVSWEFAARNEAGFNVTLLSKEKLLQQYGLMAVSAMENGGYCFNPVEFCQGLAKILEKRGVRIFEQEPLRGYNPKEKVAFTASGPVRYQRLVLTNSSPRLEDGSVRNKVLLLSTSAGVTEPIPEDKYQQAFKGGPIMGWDAPQIGYMYFRPVGNDRLLIGGGDRLISLSDARQTMHSGFDDDRKCLTDFLETTFPALKGVQFSHVWRDTMPVAIDVAPLVGEFQPNHYLGLYSPGLPAAFRAGQVLAQVVMNEHDHSTELFRHDRRMPLSRRARALVKYEPFTSVANRFLF
jgi:gamma-glutamylputrescine oxidase